MSTMKDTGREQVYVEHIDISENLEALEEAEGDILHTTIFEIDFDEGCPKTAPDGRTVLVPQPSNDSNDPLN